MLHVLCGLLLGACSQLGQRYVNAFTAAGVLGLMYSLKLFRYLAINKKMATMWETLYRASGDLAAFLVGCVRCWPAPPR